MTTYRKLYTKTLESTDINDMPDDFTRLTWTYLSLIVDREGRALDDLVYLRSKLYPRREDVTTAMISSAMKWFADRGMIHRYCVKGERYFHIVNFGKYQGDTHRESASIYPPEGEDSSTAVENPEPGHLAGEPLSITKAGLEPATTSEGKEAEQSQPDTGVTRELRGTNSRPDSYSNSDSDSNSYSDSYSDSTPYADPPTTTTAAPPADPTRLQQRLVEVKHKVRLMFGDSAFYQAMLVDALDKYGPDEVEYAVNESSLQGGKTWQTILDILRKRAKLKPKSTAPPWGV